MTGPLDLARSFVHLGSRGEAEPIDPTPSFWRDSGASGAYDRIVGAFDFASAEDLHAATEEMHPEGDEVIYLVSGGIDVVLREDGSERRIPLGPGQAAIVPRGVWHRLEPRAAGRLLFVNHRTNMQSRPA